MHGFWDCLYPPDGRGHEGSSDDRLQKLGLAFKPETDDLRNARQLISDRNESLKLTKVKDQLPDGMTMSTRYKGTGGGMRQTIDKSLDVLEVNRQAGNYTTLDDD